MTSMTPPKAEGTMSFSVIDIGSLGAMPAPQGLLSSWLERPVASLYSGSLKGSELGQGRLGHTTGPEVRSGRASIVTQLLVSLGARAITSTQSSEVERTRPPRHEELRWIRSHSKELAALDGQWIVVEGARLIASGSRLKDVIARAESVGISNPFVHRVEAPGFNIVRIGL